MITNCSINSLCISVFLNSIFTFLTLFCHFDLLLSRVSSGSSGSLRKNSQFRVADALDSALKGEVAAGLTKFANKKVPKKMLKLAISFAQSV